MHVWDLGPGALIASSVAGDLALHHHPAVQIGIGVQGLLTVTDGNDVRTRCQVVVVASGTRHAVQPQPGATSLTIFLAAETPEAIVLNELSRSHSKQSGIWIVPDSQRLVDTVVATLAARGPEAAVRVTVDAICRSSHPGSRSDNSVHPQLLQAIDLVSSTLPDAVDLESVATAVGLSPDYLGRLWRRQMGMSFSATTRWARLIAAYRHLAEGRSITDAAHEAGFADGSHANRVCKEMTGVAPRDFLRALKDPSLAG